VDVVTQEKWDRAAKGFDLMAGYGPERRWRPEKDVFFSRMGEGRILFLAVGTGLDIQFFPPGRNIDGIDISEKMLDVARPRAARYGPTLKLHHADVHELPFEDGSFDQVFTSCTFCSVPDPVRGLEALRRALVPGGELHMFEHTGSRHYPFKIMMNVMTPLSRRFGPAMNRKTVDNVQAAGFTLQRVHPVFLDIVKTIHATA
jgi:ubiquinone/menaquinone biosynthesis C-methylase UbiE